ncbi:MAG: HAD-IIA family hydrolase [Chloroflexi bacterium]|nr:HAD-IIA family hydrolase [Chloroflexota bacterium]
MFLEQYDIFLMDLDGVVFLGEHPLPAAAPSLHQLRSMGKTLRFLTNDPRPTREQVLDRLKHMGIEAQLQEIVTSGWATATFLAQNHLHSAYLVGSVNLGHELHKAGITLVERGRPQAVVIGCDEQIAYRHLQQATTLITQGARFIATNADAWFPTPDGLSPATGAIVEAIRVASGRRPLIIGKPFPAMFATALQGLASNQRVVMVGDNPSTDILGAHQLGMTAILVSQTLPHFPTRHDFRTPDAVIPDLSHLFDPLFSLRRWEQPAFTWPERVEAGVAAVIFDGEGRVLLGKRADNGLWGLPSGHMERGETIEEAVVREIREETGLHVKVVKLIGLYSDPISQVFSYPEGDIVQFLTACFQCIVVGGKLHCDGSEILDIAFVPVDTLPPNLLPMHPRWLSDALTGATGSFIR